MKISNLKIGPRLASGFSILLLLIVFMSISGILSLKNMTESAEKIIQQTFKKEQQAKEWQKGSLANGIRTIAQLKSSDPEHQQYFKNTSSAQTESITKIQKELEDTIFEAEEKTLFTKVSEKRAHYLQVRDSILKLKSDGKETEAQALIDKNMIPALDQYQTSIDDVLAYYDKEIIEAEEIIQTNSQAGIWILILSGIFSFILGSIIAWILTKSITKPLNQALSITQKIAKGHINGTPYAQFSKDEIGLLLSSLNQMEINLSTTITEIRNGSEMVASASSQIAAGNLDLSSRTEEQASALEETAATMEELTSTVKLNASNSKEANKLALSASNQAQEGGQLVKEVVNKMKDIKDSSQKIVEIISVIDSIAFQTNILALNAAVEAARAGEQGRGFAVVASEVRNLSRRSADAAKEIKTLIETSSHNVNEGSHIVNSAGQKMNEIVNSIKNVSIIIADISAASIEQSSGIEQVNQAVVQMDNVTQQNAALVEQAAAAAQSLEEQGVHLSKVVSKFKLESV